jgi:hypothetical protein
LPDLLIAESSSTIPVFFNYYEAEQDVPRVCAQSLRQTLSGVHLGNSPMHGTGSSTFWVFLHPKRIMQPLGILENLRRLAI